MDGFKALPTVKAIDAIIDGCREQWNSPANSWELNRIDDLEIDLRTRIKHLNDLEDLSCNFPFSDDQRIRLSEYIEGAKRVPKKYLKTIYEYRTAVSGYMSESARRYEFSAYVPNQLEFWTELHSSIAATNDIAQGFRKDLMVKRELKTRGQLGKEAEEKTRNWKYHLDHRITIPDKESQAISEGTWAVFEVASAILDEEYDLTHTVCVGIPIGHPRAWGRLRERREDAIKYLDFLATIPGQPCYPEMCYLLLKAEVNSALARKDLKRYA